MAVILLFIIAMIHIELVQVTTCRQGDCSVSLCVGLNHLILQLL
jgi:hypothetical protein